MLDQKAVQIASRSHQRLNERDQLLVLPHGLLLEQRPEAQPRVRGQVRLRERLEGVGGQRVVLLAGLGERVLAGPGEDGVAEEQRVRDGEALGLVGEARDDGGGELRPRPPGLEAQQHLAEERGDGAEVEAPDGGAAAGGGLDLVAVLAEDLGDAEGEAGEVALVEGGGGSEGADEVDDGDGVEGPGVLLGGEEDVLQEVPQVLVADDAPVRVDLEGEQLLGQRVPQLSRTHLNGGLLQEHLSGP